MDEHWFCEDAFMEQPDPGEACDIWQASAQEEREYLRNALAAEGNPKCRLALVLAKAESSALPPWADEPEWIERKGESACVNGHAPAQGGRETDHYSVPVPCSDCA